MRVPHDVCEAIVRYENALKEAVIADQGVSYRNLQKKWHKVTVRHKELLKAIEKALELTKNGDAK